MDVEGAPCADAGGTTDCPGGQACGNDGKCSARALACSATRCTPGVGGACLDPDGLETAGATAQARRCTDSDPVCGAWVVEPCAPSGLSCAVRAPQDGAAGAWCTCPDAPAGSRELFARPGGSLRGQAPFATGAASPAICGFRRLSDALAEAAEIVADPLAVATVTAIGAGSDPSAAVTVTFSAAASGEEFPLFVPGRVTLGSDARTGGGTYRIVFDGEGLPSVAVALGSGGTLSGFTVKNGSGDATRDALRLSCGGRTAPGRIADAVLDGAGTAGARLGRGVVVEGTCGVLADGVQVRGFSGAGYHLDADPLIDPAPLVSVSRGSVTGCGDGVVVEVGHVALHSDRIAGNARMGVRANTEREGIPRVEIRGSTVEDNGDTGIAVASALEVRITGTTVSRNGALTAWGGAGVVPSSVSRRAGGIVLWGTPPAAGAFEFGRNRIFANQGDQVLALGTGSTWVLDGPSSCGSDASGPLYTIVGCYDPASSGGPISYRGVVAIDAYVSARYLRWADITASPNDSWSFGTGAITGGGQYCSDVDQVPACP